MSWRTGLGLALLVAAIVSGWSAWRMRDRSAPAAAQAQRSDYVLRDFELVALGKDGAESLRLRAPQLQRSRDDESLDIDAPVFLIPAAQGPWRVRADRGWVSPDGDLARLEGDVSGHSDPAEGPPTTFRTTRLELLPDQDLVRTGAPVTLTRPGIMQTGTGLEANLKTRQYRLLSQVRTRYEPSVRR
ncbi:LPS export ABC transporter periplasmic protein LptC [Pseudoxanthomonas broegbernensis]|uniref:Lipopolysaccharide export system protein LptC n=1 Tax=Pseudoxanthomonas broegbernensis TaxID=83619 RepID=A0A7V8K6B0_9GAMM|nr:LPS export ABC transporter periplasmic protein LptC [Pseudoxanthomonas broegbernensis]KAF1684848.1 LPS export ABC transporter periplasmic protein LptC [Pseudoxanthomonas broegbernensis]MBB6065277.1 lipopolysaccharide export system protein LptC [Pseudoxanthomonas broegbernensis]